MGRWRAAFIVSRIISASKSITSLNINRNPPLRSLNSPFISEPRNCFFDFRSFSALPSVSPRDADEFDIKTHDFNQNQVLEEESLENEEAGKIPVKAFFLSTSIDLKSMQAENSRFVVPPTSRSSSNSIALRFRNPPWKTVRRHISRPACLTEFG